MTPREQTLSRQLEECRQELAAARRENELLRQKIDLLVRRVFGSSSERLDRSQLELLLQLSQPIPQETLPAAEKQLRLPMPRRERAPRLPEHLPVVEEVIDPEPVKESPEAWRCIGQEVSEQLDYEPARFLRRRVIRRKYVHRTRRDSAPLIAALPERLLDRSLPAPGLLAHILVGKYCDHLPLYRQEQIFLRRHGVHLPRQTLARWVGMAAEWLKPIYEHIRTGVMAGGYVQVDETPINYLEPGYGRAAGRVETCFITGNKAVRRRVSKRSFRPGSPAPFSVTGIQPIVPLPTNAAKAFDWPGAGRMCGASFTTPWNFHRGVQAGSCVKSNTCIAWRRACASIGPVHSCARLCAQVKAVLWWSEYYAP